MKTIVVLNDGETWTDANGCSITVVSETQLDALMSGVKPKDLGLFPFAKLTLTDEVVDPLHGHEEGSEIDSEKLGPRGREFLSRWLR